MSKPTWGGARNGAGRPAGEREHDANLHIKIPSGLLRDLKTRARRDKKPYAELVREGIRWVIK